MNFWIQRPKFICLGILILILLPTLIWAHTLTLGVGRDLYLGRDSATLVHGSTAVWEGLTRLDDHLRAVPCLAQSWHSSPNGRVWFFQLRNAVKFHNGTRLTAELAATSISRLLNHARYDPMGNLKSVDRVAAQGEHTLVFYLKRPVPLFPERLADYGSPILHPDSFDSNGQIKMGQTHMPIATGPFMVADIRPGRYIRLKAFGGHWGPLPHFDQVVFRTIPNAVTRMAALRTGMIDALADVGGILPEQLPILKKCSGLNLGQVESAVTHYLLFNCSRPPFENRELRRWFSQTLNRDRLVSTLMAGGGVVARQPYTPLTRGVFQTPSLESIAYEVPQHGQGQAARLILHNGTLGRWPYLAMAQLMESQLSQAGISVQIQILDPGGFLARIKSGDYDLALQPHTLMNGNPDFFYSAFLAQGSPRDVGWRHPRAEVLINRGRYEMDPALRHQIYTELGTLVRENCPVLPLFHDKPYYAWQSKIQGFSMDPLFRPDIVSARPVGERHGQ